MLEGAEAVLTPCKFAGFLALKKLRVEKKYRPSELDEKLRFERTRREARILGRAKEAGVLCPSVFAVGKDYILIEKLSGKTLNKIGKTRGGSVFGAGGIEGRVFFEAGELLAKLHSLDIAHGDYTPANLMLCGGKLYVIDFGLGIISTGDEEKAVDLLTFVDSVGEKEANWFLKGYLKIGKKAVFERMEKIESRGRYKEKI